MKRGRRWLKLVLVLIGLWYTGVIMFRLVFIRREPGHPSKIAVLQAQLRGIAMGKPSAGEVQRLMPALRLGGGYNGSIPRLEIEPDGRWVLTCEPKHRVLFSEPSIGVRILLLKFGKTRYPTFRIRSGCPDVEADYPKIGQ